MALPRPASLRDIQITIPDITGHRLLEEANIHKLQDPTIEIARRIQKRIPFISGKDLLTEVNKELNNK